MVKKEKSKKVKETYTLTIKPEIIEEVDRVAKKVDVSRSQMVENLLGMALDDTNLLEKAGFLELAIAGRKMIQSFKEKILKGEIRKDESGDVELAK